MAYLSGIIWIIICYLAHSNGLFIWIIMVPHPPIPQYLPTYPTPPPHTPISPPPTLPHPHYTPELHAGRAAGGRRAVDRSVGQSGGQSGPSPEN